VVQAADHRKACEDRGREPQGRVPGVHRLLSGQTHAGTGQRVGAEPQHELREHQGHGEDAQPTVRGVQRRQVLLVLVREHHRQAAAQQSNPNAQPGAVQGALAAVGSAPHVRVGEKRQE